MNLLEELTGRAFHYRRGLAGRKVCFALDGELAHEQKLVEEHAREAAEKAQAEGKASAELLILAALRNGRARFEGEIGEVTALRPATITNVLHRLRRKGLVEQTHVGNFRLWSITNREE